MSTKRIYLFVLIMGQLSLALGQTYNRRYDALGQSKAGSALGVQTENGKTIIAIGSPYTDTALGWGYSSVMTILVVDSSGVPTDTNLFYTPYVATYPGSGASLFSIPSGGYGVAGSSVDTNVTQRPVLYLMDDNGVPITSYSYGVAGESWIGRNGIACQDGGYVIVGETSSGSPNLDVFLLKIDSLGNQEWVQTYGDPPAPEWANSVVELNGGYYIGGRRRGPTNDNHLLIRVDSLGNFLWEQEYGGSDNEERAFITARSDGTLAMASSTTVSGTSPNQVVVAAIDQSGTIIWSKTPGGISLGYANFMSIKEVLPSGDLITAGTSKVNGFIQGQLLRMGALGDSIWMRQYSYADSLWTQGQGVFWDANPTGDGGFIAVGSALQSSNNPNDSIGLYDQDVWVVKVDSMGCIVPGCDSLHTGITTQITNLGDALQIYPNPTSTNETFSVEVKIPEAYRTDELYLTLLNSIGQRISEMQVVGSRMEIIAPADVGLYYLHLSSESTWLSGQKVVVE